MHTAVVPARDRQLFQHNAPSTRKKANPYDDPSASSTQGFALLIRLCLRFAWCAAAEVAGRNRAAAK